MKKAGTTIFFVLLFIAFYNTGLKAQSCVVFCTETGAYGYAYGAADACDLAQAKCEEYGGTNPVKLASSSSKGFGAIALGEDEDGGRVIGCAVAYATRAKAEKAAKDQVTKYGGTGVVIQNWWNDK